MKRRVVHQWRDWILEYVGDGRYELINKLSQEISPITAKNAMDAENLSRAIIKKAQTGS